jgi:hypothetical protein
LDRYSTLQYPQNTKTRVRTDGGGLLGEGCGPTSYHGDEDGVCVNSFFYHAIQGTLLDHTKNKWVIGHEFGHRQADANRGPDLQNAYVSHAFGSTANPCNCLGISSLGLGGVCLESRMNVGGGWSEGWANMYAAAIFNDRSDGGSYGNCKMAWWNKAYDTTPPALPSLPTFDGTPPVDLDCAFAPKWMERYCGTANEDRGVALDWTNFFWLLYANGAKRYEASEIASVWVEARPELHPLYDPVWDDLVGALPVLWPSDQAKRDQFTDKGTWAGVNY